MPPTVDDVRRALALISSRDELEYFYDQLSSPEWIPALREAGLLEASPEPVEAEGGIAFPHWGLSRYLTRVAPTDPAAVSDAIAQLADSRNPRVRRDLAEALVAMPAQFSLPFLERLSAWVHDPYNLSVERAAADLGQKLVAEGLKDGALDLIAGVAALVAPETWQADAAWVPLERYDYAETVHGLAVAAAARFGVDVIYVLSDELARGLDAEFGPRATDEPARDLSFIWRPAIEDHPQNQDLDHKAKLVVAIRDAITTALEQDPSRVGELVDDLLARPWSALRRLALHTLTEFGESDARRLSRILTDPAIFGDVDVHHEFYRLASIHFRQLDAAAQERYFEVLDEVAAKAADDDDPENGERRRRWWTRNRLGAIEAYLPQAQRDRFEALARDFGPGEHPDFLSYHTSWTGPTSPLSAVEVGEMSAEALITYLTDWKPSEGERGPSAEGLARTLTEVVKISPRAYVDVAPQFADLEPAYARGLLFGFREGLRAGETFEWGPVIDLCAAIVRQPGIVDEAAAERGRDPGWTWARTEVAHLLDAGLEERPGRLPIGLRDRIWPIIQLLSSDPNPTTQSESRFGPPNMDPLTYSINTTRGVAMHAVCGYAWWLRHHALDVGRWLMSEDAPEAAAVLEAHLDPEREPSIAVRAVYGWWLPWLIQMDSQWIRSQLDRLLGRLASPLELAAWETYLVRGGGDRLSYEVLAPYYATYAAILSGEEEAPGRRVAGVTPVERYIDHLLALRDRMLAGGDSPLRSLLERAPAWLVSSVVDRIGHAIYQVGAVDQSLSDSFRTLWFFIRETLEARGTQELAALGPFGWWFASRLPAEWTLAELAWVAGQGGQVQPTFIVVPRLAEVAELFPDMTLEVLEVIVGRTQEPWELRATEDDLRRILAPALASDEPLVSARARALTNRLGRLGLHGLRALVAPDRQPEN